MEPSKIARIKSAVKHNFDQSPLRYQAFEQQHGLFASLTAMLLKQMYLPARANILDIGCGTGASTALLLTELPRAKVWGLDISPAMLALAHELLPESDRLFLVEGDAACLSDLFDTRFDGILYSASMFLIPDFESSLRQSVALLQPGGCVGLSFLEGVFDENDGNVLAIADQTARTGVSMKKAVKFPEFRPVFASLFPVLDSWTVDLEPSRDLIRDFYCVPAMSAGLYPGLPYEQRLAKVRLLLDHQPATPWSFRWHFMVGRL